MGSLGLVVGLRIEDMVVAVGIAVAAVEEERVGRIVMLVFGLSLGLQGSRGNL